MPEPVPTFDPRRAALLVMDYQNGIVDRVADAGALLARARDAIAAARRGGMQVGYVRVAFADADYAAVPDTNKTFSAITAGRAMHDDAPETAVPDDLAPEPGDIVVRKTRVGAFSTTDLDRQLREREIDTLVLAGISTSGVVLSTVRDAADRDYRLYVLADGCADPDPANHEFLTQKIFPRQSEVISIADFTSWLAPD
jgi:nicotinamidase-related amidase